MVLGFCSELLGRGSIPGAGTQSQPSILEPGCKRTVSCSQAYSRSRSGGITFGDRPDLQTSSNVAQLWPNRGSTPG